MHGEADNDYRFVIDEGSLDWRGLTSDELTDALDAFADLLDPLADGRLVAILDLAFDVQCLASTTFNNLLYSPDPRVPRDTRNRLISLIGKCRILEPREEDTPQRLVIADVEHPEPSWGMSHALVRASAGRTMGSLVAPATEPLQSGWVHAEYGEASAEIYILGDLADLPSFWRRVVLDETNSETDFFALAKDAFPNLLFAQDLRFARFDGGYDEVLPWLVKLLSALSDQLADTLARHKGDHNLVIAEFSALGLDISPESPSTRKNAKSWSQRVVTYESVGYRCEWHGKRLWNTDRVHFSLPITDLKDKILIGVFVDHLDT